VTYDLNGLELYFSEYVETEQQLLYRRQYAGGPFRPLRILFGDDDQRSYFLKRVRKVISIVYFNYVFPIYLTFMISFSMVVMHDA